MIWHALEMQAFVHYSTNTFTDQEWGYGDAAPEVFNPSAQNVNQWVGVMRETGLKGIILTCKHHDGFCLWPSKYTDYSVADSPYQNGHGDVVKEVANACNANGLQFGIYLSPWDRHQKSYGTEAYLQYYRNQLTELFSAYGPVFEMWFDGANGGDGYYGGANTTRHIDGARYYRWPETLDMVRRLEPDVLFFSDAGPGIRWVGNERGVAGRTNWNCITPDTLYAGKTGIEDLLNTGSEDGTQWIPAETNVSIRPGWFYHAGEDSLVKTPAELFNIYLTSVGRGSTLLLNIPPDKNGLIHETDIRALKGWRALLDEAFGHPLTDIESVSASGYRGTDPQYAPVNVVDEDPETYWALDDGQRKGYVELRFSKPQTVSYLMLQEYIRLGQRVRSFRVDALVNGQWTRLADETTIGYKRILRFPGVITQRLKVTITDSRACPCISEMAVY